MRRHRVRIYRRPAHVPADMPLEPVSWRGVFTGCRYQCVELARRYLLQTRGLVFDRIDNAHEIFSLLDLKDPFQTEQDPVPWPSHPNWDYSSAACPAGSLLIWASAGFYEPTGHVAVVVRSTGEWVEIVEQNEETTRRRLPVLYGRIQCTRPDTTIMGWKPAPQQQDAPPPRQPFALLQ
jgi:hypothetical protein